MATVGAVKLESWNASTHQTRATSSTPLHKPYLITQRSGRLLANIKSTKLTRKSGRVHKVIKSKVRRGKKKKNSSAASPAAEKSVSSRAAANNSRVLPRRLKERGQGPIVLCRRDKLTTPASPPITSKPRLGHTTAASTNGGKKKKCKSLQTKQFQKGGTTKSGAEGVFAQN